MLITCWESRPAVIKVTARSRHRLLELRRSEFAGSRRGTQMKGRLSRWGIGPEIAVAALAYAAIAGAATRRWSEICLLHRVPFIIPALVGGALVVVGVPLLVVAARTVMRGYNKDQLVTSGASALVRHPIYSAWIVFILPGLVLLTRSWLLLLTPFVAYVVFKLRIHCEDEYLEQRFGEAYLKYRGRVNELIPLPRRHAN